MSTPYRAAREAIAAQGGPAADTEHRLPCTVCGTATLHATLAQYGARCWSCFDAYCRERPATPTLAFTRPSHGDKAWAHQLRHREQQGEALPALQRRMWRQALHVPLGDPA